MPFDAVAWNRAGNRAPRVQIVCTSGSWPTSSYTGTVPAPLTQLFNRYYHKNGQLPATQLQALFGGFTGTVGSPRGERPMLNGYTLRGAWEPGPPEVAAWNKATWDGADSITVGAGVAPFATDPIGHFLAPGQGMWFRSSLTVPNLAELPSGRSLAWTVGTLDSTNRGDGRTDSIWGAGLPISSGGTAYGGTVGICPLAIVGIAERRYPSIIILGTSIERGVNYTGDGLGSLSWAELGCNNPAGGLPNHPHTNLSIGGGTYQLSTARFGTGRATMFRYASHVVCGFPINDCTAGRTLAQIQADLAYVWGVARASGVVHITASLSFPYTDATNTTPNAITAPGAIVEQYENWIKAYAPDGSGRQQIDAIIDPAPVGQVRATANPRLWHASVFGSGDGLHPESASHVIAGAELGKLTATFTV